MPRSISIVRDPILKERRISFAVSCGWLITITMELANPFEQHNRYRGRKVEAAGLRGHRDSPTILLIGRKETFRQTPRFPTEHQVVSLAKGSLPIPPLRLGGQQISSRRWPSRRFKFSQVFPVSHIHLMPVIHPCAPKLPIID